MGVTAGPFPSRTVAVEGAGRAAASLAGPTLLCPGAGAGGRAPALQHAPSYQARLE